MGRGATTYITVFLSGIITAKFINIYIPLVLIVSILLFLLLIVLKRYLNKALFILISHIIFLCLGITHYYIKSSSDQSQNSNAIQIRENISIKLNKLVSTKNERAVLSAITLGSKSELSKELKKAYSNSGAMHILALSGLHIGIIYGIISSILFFLNFSYKTIRLKFFISVIIIFFYAYITGFSPSVQRAGIMILVHNIATIWNRKPCKYNIIAISAFFITIINPHQLFNIGFQLSFAAVIGIAVIFPVIDESFKVVYLDKLSIYRYIRKAVYAIWGMIGISIACQITTLPFTMYYFGLSTPYFLLTNLAAIPIATIILYLFLPAIIFSEIPVIGNLTIELLSWLLKLLNTIVEFIG